MMTFLRIVIIGSVLVAGWQALIHFAKLPDYILPAPLQVAMVFEHQYALLLQQTVPTLIETSLGLGLGILFGCFTAFLLSLYRPLSRWFLPLLITSQAIPTFAIAPMLVIWLGYGIASKIAMAILMVFFPVASACHDGLRRTPSEWLQLAKTMNASRWRLFYRIRLPAALPSLASGIRIAAVAAPIGAVVGEWVGASRGLGYLMLNANARMQIDQMFAALIVIIIMALLLYFCIDRLLQKLIWWN